MMASRFKIWLAQWQKTRDATQDTAMAIQEVSARAKADQDLPKIELEDLDEALATMKEATVLGADRFGPRFIKSLPKDGGKKLVDLLNQCEEQAGLRYIGMPARQGGQMRATHFLPDNAVPHLESYEESFCDRVVRREGGILGRCCERHLAVASCSATTGGR